MPFCKLFSVSGLLTSTRYLPLFYEIKFFVVLTLSFWLFFTKLQMVSMPPISPINILFLKNKTMSCHTTMFNKLSRSFNPSYTNQMMISRCTYNWWFNTYLAFPVKNEIAHMTFSKIESFFAVLSKENNLSRPPASRIASQFLENIKLGGGVLLEHGHKQNERKIRFYKKYRILTCHYPCTQQR